MGCNFVLIPGLRVDQANRPMFLKKGGGNAYTSANLLVAAVYSF